jgi:hypothetical protein
MWSKLLFLLGILTIGFVALTILLPEAAPGTEALGIATAPAVDEAIGLEAPPTPEPTPTPKIEPSPTPESAPTPRPSPTPTFGSRENPVPLGTVVDLGDGWRIKVISVTPNANEVIQATNEFNTPPKAGHQFFIARIWAKYTGTESSYFGGIYRLRSVGSQAVSYSTFGKSCGVVPDELPDPEIFTGGVIAGNICWEIRAGDETNLERLTKPFDEF